MEFEQLPADIYFLLRDFLNYVDFTALRFTCGRLYEIPPRDMREIVRDKLSQRNNDNKNINDSVDELFDDLHKLNGVISGSFILNCLYEDAPWQSNDVDIFYQFTPENNNYLIKFQDRADGSIGDKYVATTDIFTKTQFIQTQNSPMKTILYTFDMDICKNAFDGKRLFVRDWNDLFSRTSYHRRILFLDSMYMMDWNTFIDSNSIDIKTYEQRQRKYIARGFKVIDHPKNDLIIDIQANPVCLCEGSGRPKLKCVNGYASCAICGKISVSKNCCRDSKILCHCGEIPMIMYSSYHNWCCDSLIDFDFNAI